MDICILAAGAAGMYCGSCIRDNALASALLRAGHRVSLVPLYTPLRTDTAACSIDQVFYGGVNAYLQYASKLFRRTPRAVDWILDRPWLLSLTGQFGAQSSPAKLGPFVISILQGEEGPQVKELRRLIDFLKSEVKPAIISLPNLMFAGVAPMLRRELNVPIVCELTGEDIFLDALIEPYRSQAQALIRQRISSVDRLVATSRYYADRMAEYLAVSPDRIDVVYPGISRDHVAENPPGRPNRPPTLGYFARICPEKGIDRLIEAFALLRKMSGMSEVRLRIAGYLGAAHRDWHAKLQRRIQSDGLAAAIDHVGEVDFPGKLAFLDSIDLLSVPTAYPEPKGMYLLESLARAVPAVQPAHGAFPELIRETSGGLLTPPGDPAALAAALAELIRDEPRRVAFGKVGHAAVRDRFTDDHMAARMLEVYQEAQA